MAKAGRPTDYKESYNKQAFKLCLLGATDKELADFFEVAESSINLWKKQHPKFSESIKKGKIQADSNVAEKLYKRANGYQYTEKHETVEQVKVNGEAVEGAEKVIKKTIVKEVVPDVTAQIFWTKNRRKENWRDKIDHSLGADKDNPISVIIRGDDAKL